MRIVTMPIQSQGIITRDNVSVDVSAVAYFRVVDPVRSVVAIENPDAATISIAGERYVLLRAASLSVEFMELVTKLYQDQGEAEARSVANNLLFDLAHALGRADARRRWSITLLRRMANSQVSGSPRSGR